MTSKAGARCHSKNLQSQNCDIKEEFVADLLAIDIDDKEPKVKQVM
jgi:hypothetical protein